MTSATIVHCFPPNHMRLSSLPAIVLRNGLFFGLSLCVYTLLMWLTRLDAEYLSVGQYFDMAVVIVPIFFILSAIKQARDQTDIHVGHRVLIAMGTGLVGYLIHGPFLYFYHHVVNPDWFEAVLALEKQNMLAKQASAEDIGIRLEEMIAKNQAQDGIFSVGALIASAVVLPLLISMLSLVVVRRRPKTA